jgi:hypothetical protein
MTKKVSEHGEGGRPTANIKPIIIGGMINNQRLFD